MSTRLDKTIDHNDDEHVEDHLSHTLARLEESESLLRSVIENAQHFGVYRIAAQRDYLYAGKVLLVSPSITDILGIDDPYRFESWFENLHPDDRQRVIEANYRSLREAVPYNQPTRFFNKRQNRWCWVHTISNPCFDSQGNLTHFDGIVIDLTEQKEAELALQELNATLEQRVEERTHELEHRREIAESLRDIIRMINSSMPLAAFLAQAVRMAAQRLDAAACVLHRLDVDNQLITHMASYGLDGIFEKGGSRPFDNLKMSGGYHYLQATLQRQPTYGNYPPIPEWVEEIERDPMIPPQIKAERRSYGYRENCLSM